MNQVTIKMIIEYLKIMELDLNTPIDKDIIAKNYRRLSKKYHPDVADKKYSDGKKMSELNNANDFLRNNIEYVNLLISKGFREFFYYSGGYKNNNYDYSSRYQEEERKRQEERRRQEEERKHQEEIKRRQEEERKRQEEIRRKEEERKRQEEIRRKEMEKRELRFKVENMINSINKEYYYENSYEYIINEINMFLKELDNMTYYYQEYIKLIKRIKKIKTIEYCKKIAKIKKNILRLCSLFSIIFVFCILLINLTIPGIRYNNAINYLKNKNYDQATNILIDLDGFYNSEKYIELVDAYKLLDNDKYIEAIELLKLKNAKINISYDTDGGELVNYNKLGDEYNIRDSKKKGYNFIDYKVENYEISVKKQISLDLNLLANYEAIEYYISYDTDGGILNESDLIKYTIETNTFTLPVPSKEGYSFVGWFDRSNKQVYNVEKGSYGNVFLKAKYELKTYNIEYNLNGGEFHSNVSYSFNIESNNVYIENPTRDGYTFIGWKVNNNNELLINYKILSGTSEDIHLNANWQANEYEIKYNLDGGVNNSLNPNGYITNNGDIVLKYPAKIGYDFIGWTTNSNDFPIKDFIIQNGSFGKIELTANYKPKEFRFLFDLNGGQATSQINSFVCYDSNYSLFEPIRIGYEFVNWTYKGVEFQFTGIFKELNNVQLIAQWKPIEYKINYELDGGSNSELNPNTYNINDNVLLFSPSKEGYRFIGWSIEEDGIPPSSFDFPEYMVKDITIYAKFVPITYLITYNVNSGEKLESNYQYVEFDSYFTPYEPKKKGYTFEGWFLNGELFESDKWTLANDAYLVAHWKPNNYCVKIIDDVSNDFSVIYDSRYKIENITKSNYIFKGYYTEPYGKGEKYTDEYGSSLKPFKEEHDIILYPYYQYQILFESNGGEFVDAMIFDEDEFLSEAIVSSKQNKTFAGWYTDINLTSKFENILGNVKVYAKWLEETETSLFNYSFDNGCYINGYNGTVTIINIPTHIGGQEVNKLQDAVFKDNLFVTNIIIPDEIKEIPSYLCSGCKNLENIYIPNRVIKIETNAFANCESLKEIIIPNSVEQIMSGILYNCKSLEKITIPFMCEDSGKNSSLKYIVGNYPDNLNEIILTNSRYIGDYCFSELKSLEKITLPENLHWIRTYAFYNCENLKEIIIPSNVRYIEDDCFSSCDNLRSVEILSEVIFMGYGVFRNCYLEMLKAPYPTSYRFTDGGSQSDSFGHSLIETYIVTGSTPIKKYYDSWYDADVLNGIKKIYVSDNVPNITYDAFRDCEQLVELNIPSLDLLNGPLLINNDNFNNLIIRNGESLSANDLSNMNEFLKTITLPKSLSFIDSDTFNACTILEMINSDGENFQSVDGVLYSSDYSIIHRFPRYSSKKEYKILESTTVISEYCFYGCTNIEKLFLSDNINIIGNKSLNGIKELQFIYFGKNIDYIYYDMFFNTNNLCEIQVSNDNKIYDSRENCNAVIETLTNTLILGAKNTIIPESVTIIGKNSFYKCESITSIIIPSNIEKIEAAAFYGCSTLSKVYLSDGIKCIEDSAFSRCTSLSDIFIPKSVSYIGSGVFCHTGASIYLEKGCILSNWDSDWNWSGKYNLNTSKKQLITYYDQER